MQAVTRPAVAVVIPVRNRCDMLRKCLCQIAAQDFDVDLMEVIVCDDGSTEDISPLLDQFRPALPHLRLMRQPARGPAAA